VLLWGEQGVHQATQGVSVEWRASAANFETLRAYQQQFSEAGDEHQQLAAYLATQASGIQSALAEGQAYYHERAAPATPIENPTSPAPTAPIFVVTDALCASACLDAAELWVHLGAIQVGGETSADTLYLDAREDALPSGQARLSLPMKVYRGRARGANEPLHPRHRPGFALTDTTALERWIMTLPEYPNPGTHTAR